MRKDATREEYNSYMKEYMARRYLRRREAALHQLGGRCAVCGAKEDLVFDHVDASTKSFSIARRIAGASEAKLQEELKKCQLLCADCHQKKTSRLTEEIVLEARRRWRPHSRDNGAAALAREFGVSKATMSMALRRKTWKHI